MRPEKGSYPEYYENYIPLVKQENIITALTQNLSEVKALISSVPASKEDYAYAGGKWTVKQLLLHVSDTERIFSYRALRFARKDPQQPLPFEENDYAAAADVSGRSLADIMQELETVRVATLSLFKSFSQDELLRSGNTAAGRSTVLAIGFTTCGHATHHMNILRERYLKK